ncbi:E3 ubiquitin-protein ligase RHA2A-like [Andrographis paniculata]|uniref:E3 ubiquitin-protein ligase RHA2A-like n=1 Tax=Andrographis paniculata TaxID=175694 RepID=UPI0021E76E84|nr:E3 ubiquitin-protein ligase RHA2A-like [Andrographis paniculata]
MGLQNHPADVSSESILFFTVLLLARSASYLQSLLLAIVRRLSIFPRLRRSGGSLSTETSLVAVLRDQFDEIGGGLDAECVVCLNRLGEENRLRRLACRHVFHKDCLDRWLDYLNFTCPLCRAPLDTGGAHALRFVEEELRA